MAFSSTIVENTSPLEQESKFLVEAPFMASNKGNNTINAHAVLEQEQNFQEFYHQNQNNLISFGMMQSASSAAMPCNFISKDSGAYDLGEALFLYLDSQEQSRAKEESRKDLPPSLPLPLFSLSRDMLNH
ncbi:bZIP transcription factor TGA10-like [Olea europaea var. sylvestris]|uniref:bZIP transcription factor TGA10-like n=1 Tax=Olea europaea var. sylvestris TaxID=158386 RepID=UPI000C1D4EB6|nr:bZIP transcription factor TGA10-like [Olea europaea var. sylvestris]